jgi:hypothetical protein
MTVEKLDKSVQFVAKLVQLTQDKKIKWDGVSSPRATGDKVSRAEFLTTVEDTKLRVFEATREVVLDATVGILFGSRDQSKTRMVKVPILEVLDDQGRVTYTFENKTGLGDLYQAAAYSASKVDDLIDAVLRKK